MPAYAESGLVKIMHGLFIAALYGILKRGAAEIALMEEAAVKIRVEHLRDSEACGGKPRAYIAEFPVFLCLRRRISKNPLIRAVVFPEARVACERLELQIRPAGHFCRP